MLDVACNDGALVDELRKCNRNAFGVDPAASLEHYYCMRAFFTAEWVGCGSRMGLSNEFACVTALNVFAHVDDLDDFTRGVHALLEPCGLFVIEVGYLPDVVKRGAFDTVYHEHVSYHHLSPLVRFFKRHGMRMVDAHRIDSQGGSVRIFVRNCDREHVGGGDDGHQLVHPRMLELLTEETTQGVWPGVKALKKVQADERKWLLSFARHHKLTGKPIAVFGAPAKLTTYLAATQLFPDRIGLVVDDNPNKVGRYVPGTRLLIQPTSALRDYKPTGILCASWNFAEDIRKRYADLDAEWFVPFEDRRPETCPRGHVLDDKGECGECGLKVAYK